MSLAFQILKSKINKTVGRPLPVKLTLALTSLCNSRCKICNVWKVYKEFPERPKEELTTKDWKKLFDEIGANLGWIDFTGGEPTLKKDMKETIIYAYNNTAISAATLTTNAILAKSIKIIEKTLCEIPKNKILIVGISLDGVPEVHDKIRGVKRNFEKALRLFNEFKTLKKQYRNLIVNFAYTISEYNAGKFGIFYNFLKENYGVFISDIRMAFEHFTEYYGKKFNEKSYENIKNNLLNDVSHYFKILKNRNISSDTFHKAKSAFYEFYLKNIPTFVSNPQKMIIPCVAATHSAYIDPYGTVYPCTQWKTKLGNIKERNFKEIWWEDTAKKLRNLVKQQKCPNCWTPCEAQPSWIMGLWMLKRG